MRERTQLDTPPSRLTSISLLLASHAARAPSISLKMTKPKPRLRPVARSLMMTASSTSPKVVMAAFMLASVVRSKSSERTNTLRESELALATRYTSS